MLCSWSADNSIVVGSAKSKNVGTSAASPSVTTTILKQDYGYNNSSVRKLLNESHGIFTRFLSAAKEWEESKFVSVAVLQSTSIEFRVCIRACCLNLETELADADPGNDPTAIANIRQLQALLQLYRHMEIIWSLCDVLFFRPQGAFLTPDLLEWSRWNFTEPDDNVKEMLEWQRAQAEGAYAGPALEQHEKYWNTMYTFLMSGRVEEARKLLNAHSQVSTDSALATMDELLDVFPLSKPSQAADKSAFLNWQKDVKQCLEEGYFMTMPQLEIACQLLLGNDSAFQTLSNICRVWYQIFVGKTVFTQPYATIHDLQYLAEECQAAVAGLNLPTTALDRTIFALLQLDILSALKELCSSFRNWWCAGHLGVLLWHGGCTELLNVKNDVDLREYLLFEYGESLMACGNGLWQIAVDYLAACPTYGVHALRLAIERKTLTANDYHMTLKVLDICRKYHLYETAKSICKEKSTDALKSGRIADALSWSIQTKDTQLITYTAEKLLQSDNGPKAVQGMRILDCLSELALLSPSLTFLCKYRQMRILLDSGQLIESACLLTDLISSRIASRHFWFVLFRDLMQLLTIADKEVIFTAPQVYAIMDVLQCVLIDMGYVENLNYFIDQPDETMVKRDLTMLRSTLVKCLSSALIQKC